MLKEESKDKPETHDNDVQTAVISKYIDLRVNDTTNPVDKRKAFDEWMQDFAPLFDDVQKNNANKSAEQILELLLENRGQTLH